MTVTGPACRGLTALFFDADPDSIRQAKQICADCPILPACRRQALTGPEELFGVQAGMTPDERNRRRPKLAARPPLPPETGGLPNCGTDAGYHAHRTKRQQPCTVCRAAHAAAEKRRDPGWAKDRTRRQTRQTNKQAAVA